MLLAGFEDAFPSLPVLKGDTIGKQLLFFGA
jgi:hypothetical protein